MPFEIFRKLLQRPSLLEPMGASRSPGCGGGRLRGSAACGWAAGIATSILVRTGYGAQLEQVGVEPEGPFHRVNDLPEAAGWILQRAQFQ